VSDNIDARCNHEIQLTTIFSILHAYHALLASAGLV